MSEGGNLEEIDDFQMGSERLHNCFTASRLEPGTFTWASSPWGAILRKLTIFKQGVSVYMTVSRHLNSNRGLIHWVVFRGGDLEKIDDFQIGSERLHDCFTTSRLELTFTWGCFPWGRSWEN